VLRPNHRDEWGWILSAVAWRLHQWIVRMNAWGMCRRHSLMRDSQIDLSVRLVVAAVVEASWNQWEHLLVQEGQLEDAVSL